MNYKILVLLSSYNGERYIEEQIDSILNQEGVSVTLLIRDDNSSDSTPLILEKYANEGKIEWFSGENLGWRRSFMKLVEVASSSYDYYAFSDQDDVWLPNKLRVAVDSIRVKKDEASLYISNLIYWQDGLKKGYSMPYNIRTDIYHTLLFCDPYGCTMVFNNCLLKLIQNNLPSIEVAHDFWFYQVASILGNIIYDPNAYILYRQHSTNQLGCDKFFWEKLKRRFKRYTTIKTKFFLDKQAEELLRCYGTMMNKQQIETIEVVANYKYSFYSFIKLLFSFKYTSTNILTNIGLKYRILIKNI